MYVARVNVLEMKQAQRWEDDLLDRGTSKDLGEMAKSVGYYERTVAAHVESLNSLHRHVKIYIKDDRLPCRCDVE